MKKTVLRVLLSMALIGASGLACNRKSPSVDTGGANGYPVVCKQCGHFFAIPLDKLPTYPGGPKGEGLKCEKCGQFAALRATQCQQCKTWYIAESRGMPCPQCSKANTPSNTPPEKG
jgi:hypothetical protein